MENELSNNEAQKAAIETKLQQSTITENDLNKIGYFRNPLLDFLKTESGSKCADDLTPKNCASCNWSSSMIKLRKTGGAQCGVRDLRKNRL